MVKDLSNHITVRGAASARRAPAPARRVLVVEECPARAAVAPALGGEGRMVIVAGHGQDGLWKAGAWQPDVIVLNDHGTGSAVLELLKEIRGRGQETPVILLSSRASESDRLLAFHLGVDDYVVRPVSRLELLARVNSQLRRSARPPEPAQAEDRPTERFGAVEVQPDRRVVLRGGSAVALSPKAFHLLLALLRRNGAVATRDQLLQEVWGHKGRIETRTVDLHVVELRQKLEERPAAPRHIVTVRKVGYRLDR